MMGVRVLDHSDTKIQHVDGVCCAGLGKAASPHLSLIHISEPTRR